MRAFLYLFNTAYFGWLHLFRHYILETYDIKKGESEDSPNKFIL